MRTRIVLVSFWTLVVLAFTTNLVIVPPSTIDDFFLPGSQPNESGTLVAPSFCDNCHGDYDPVVEPFLLWQGSMMAQAARDPLFLATMTIANQDVPESGDLCIRCHFPKGWLEGRSEPTDGSALTEDDREGIFCDFCHKMVKPTPLGVNPYPDDSIYTAMTYEADQAYLMTIDTIPMSVGNGMYVVDDANIRRGPYSDPDANHQFLYSPFHSTSEFCGTCHDVSNPAFSAVLDTNGNIIDYEPNAWGTPAPDENPHMMLPVERTYSEWSVSAYNTPDGVSGTPFGGNLAIVRTCQDCHMRDTTGQGCDKNPPVRDDLPMHDLTGANTFIPLVIEDVFTGETDPVALALGIERARFMIRNAATMELSVDSVAGEVSVQVINETGHKLPTGYPEGRRIWLNVKAWSSLGEYYESGAYDTATAILTHDADAKIYEVKPGISPGLAAALGLSSGPSFHFVLNDTVYKDNRIPPRGFTNAKFDSVQASPVAYTYTDSQYWDLTLYYPDFEGELVAAEVSLFYQTTSKEYVEFLRDENVTDDWGQTMYNLWAAHGKSTPELMRYTHWGAEIIDTDHDGFISLVDCNDNDPNIHPGAIEFVDCIDNDCDGVVDEHEFPDSVWVWTGCANTEEWGNPGNWSRMSVPGLNAVVIIPDSIEGEFYPVLSDTTRLHQLVITPFATCIIDPTGVILIDATSTDSTLIVVNGELLNYGFIEITEPDYRGVSIGSNGSLYIYGELEICGAIEAIYNEGELEIMSTGLLELLDQQGSGIYNAPVAEFHVAGSVEVKR